MLTKQPFRRLPAYRRAERVSNSKYHAIGLFSDILIGYHYMHMSSVKNTDKSSLTIF